MRISFLFSVAFSLTLYGSSVFATENIVNNQKQGESLREQLYKIITKVSSSAIPAFASKIEEALTPRKSLDTTISSVYCNVPFIVVSDAVLMVAQISS
jgi:hypothetical protein